MTTTTKAVSLKKFQEETVNHVLTQVQQFQKNGAINLPKDYSPSNAMKSAWLLLLETQTMSKKPVLQECSKESICNALLNMAVQGLNPMKKQCAFIAYGNKLTMQRQYQGTIALAKRFGDLKSVHAHIVYEDDVFEYSIMSDTGLKKVIKHEQKIENINQDKIKGAYAVTILNDGTTDVEIMNITQIRKSWQQGPTNGNSPAHKNFPDQMCIKTVINRACKLLIDSSNDSALIDVQNEPTNEVQEIAPQENANTEEIDVEVEEAIDDAVEVESNVKEEEKKAPAEEENKSKTEEAPF